MINSVEGFGQIHKYSANTPIIIQFSYYQFMQMGNGEGCGNIELGEGCIDNGEGCIELASFSYVIKYRSGQRNVGPDTFTRAFCSNISAAPCNLEGLLNKLCHPGITRPLHFIRTKNLRYSTTDVKRVVSSCKICAEVKPKFS